MKPSEECHHDEDGDAGQMADEQADLPQILMDRYWVMIGWQGVGRKGERSQHPGVGIADFLVEVLEDSRSARNVSSVTIFPLCDKERLRFFGRQNGATRLIPP
jgi:hypothetical protein